MKNFALIFLTCWTLGCTENHTDSAKPKYRIAYNVWVDQENDNYEVFTMNLDGSDPINVTNFDGVEWTYHTSGTDLMYVSDKDTCRRCYFLHVTDAYGRSHEKIGGYQLKDSWHSTRKNGEEIVITPKTQNDSAFYIIDRKGNLLQKVYTGLVYFTDPSFSPDGKEIVFRGANRRFKSHIGYQDELYIIGVDGSNLRQLTHYPANDTTAQWWEYHAGPPFWEPNRDIITFHSVQQGGSYLFQINPDGTGLKKISPDSVDMGWHAWSPDGEMIAFDATTKRTDGKENYDIYTMAYTSGVITRLTYDTLYEQGPAFIAVKNPE